MTLNVDIDISLQSMVFNLYEFSKHLSRSNLYRNKIITFKTKIKKKQLNIKKVN